MTCGIPYNMKMRKHQESEDSIQETNIPSGGNIFKVLNCIHINDSRNKQEYFRSIYHLNKHSCNLHFKDAKVHKLNKNMIKRVKPRIKLGYSKDNINVQEPRMEFTQST